MSVKVKFTLTYPTECYDHLRPITHSERKTLERYIERLISDPYSQDIKHFMPDATTRYCNAHHRFEWAVEDPEGPHMYRTGPWIAVEVIGEAAQHEYNERLKREGRDTTP